MKHTDSFFRQVPAPGWEPFGELELTVNFDTDHTVGKWLGAVLNLLDLPADFVNSVLKSAQEAAAKAMKSVSVVRSKHLHLLILVPTDHMSMGGTWGFFRVEKFGLPAEDGSARDHDIEFYLYLEG
ncbi:MAG: hypothetical protein HND47_12680 [Chloroflexi bacterium]|nr:hypothetical protein [Chloroflexota bacterium]